MRLINIEVDNWIKQVLDLYDLNYEIYPIDSKSIFVNFLQSNKITKPTARALSDMTRIAKMLYGFDITMNLQSEDFKKIKQRATKQTKQKAF